jgi:uncharacterized protein involved in outer membrane biogenesis
MGAKLKKWIIRLSLLLLVFMLTVAGGMYYLYTHQEKLINPLVNQINRQLLVEVSVKDINLSFTHFPYVAVAMQKVVVPENVAKNPDTLFAVENLYLVVRPWDLLKDEMSIKAIEFNNGKLHLKTFSDGSVNYEIWKPGDEDDTRESNLSINSVIFEKMDFRFSDDVQKIKAHEYLESVQVQGDFASAEISVRGRGDLQHKFLQIDDFIYDAPIYLSTDIDVLQIADDFRLSAKKMRVNNAPFSLRLTVKPTETTLHLSTDNFDAKGAIDLLPKSYADAMNWFALDGKLSLDFNMEIPERGNPIRDLQFAIVQGSFALTDRPLEIKRLQTSGNLRFGKASNDLRGLLRIDAFEGVIDGDVFSLKGFLQDFDRPLLSVEYLANVSLENLLLMAGMEGFQEVKGKTKLEGSFENQFRSLTHFSKRDFAGARAGATFSLENGAFTYAGVPYQDVQAQFDVQHNNLLVRNFACHVVQSDIQIEGAANNLLPFLLIENEDLILEAKLNSKNLDLDTWLSKGSTSSESLYELEFPQHISASLTTKIDQFRFGSFRASNANGLVKIDAKGMITRFDRLTALGGEISQLNFKIDAQEAPYRLSLSLNAKDVNMQQMFGAFNNFGQDVLTAKELQGTLYAKLRLESLLSKSLDIPTESIQAEADLRIDKGRLIDFAPMQALSRFAHLNELNDVRFERLENTLSISRRVITVPKMDIRSNVIDLELEGTHNFDNIIDFVVRMDLREALFAERKRRRSEFDDLIVETSEGSPRIWVRMKGDAADPEISLDRTQVRRTIGEQLRDQGRQLREGSTRQRERTQYEFEWDPD